MNKFLTALFLLIICPWFLTIQLLLKIWISFFWEKKKKKNVLSNPACSTCKVSNAFPTADTPAGTSWPIIWDFPPSQSYLSHSREQFGFQASLLCSLLPAMPQGCCNAASAPCSVPKKKHCSPHWNSTQGFQELSIFPSYTITQLNAHNNLRNEVLS